MGYLKIFICIYHIVGYNTQRLSTISWIFFMSEKFTISALDLTNWFYQRAETDSTIMTEEKVQQLLFLSQMHYVLKFKKNLIPSLFVCNISGFYEATIRSVLSFGLPLMSKPNFDTTIHNFLESIWQKYSSQSTKNLNNFIVSLECWKKYYNSRNDVFVDILSFIDSSLKSDKNFSSAQKSNTSRLLFSQNGPVKVSAWQPKKITSTKK